MRTLMLSLITISLILSIASVSEAIRGDKDLAILYNFDEDNDKEVLDASENGVVATVMSAEWTEEGQFFGAMAFDGAKTSVHTPQDIPGITDTDLSAFTVEHWIFLNAVAIGTQQVWESINSAGAWPAETFIEGEHAMLFYVYDVKGKDLRADIPQLDTDEWIHIAGTYDDTTGSGKIRAYVNGKMVGEADSGGKVAFFPSDAGAIVLGKDNEADIQYLDGFIDDFAFYTRALTADEVKLDMNDGVAYAVDPAGKISTTWGRIKAEY